MSNQLQPFQDHSHYKTMCQQHSFNLYKTITQYSRLTNFNHSKTTKPTPAPCHRHFTRPTEQPKQVCTLLVPNTTTHGHIITTHTLLQHQQIWIQCLNQTLALQPPVPQHVLAQALTKQNPQKKHSLQLAKGQ